MPKDARCSPCSHLHPPVFEQDTLPAAFSEPQRSVEELRPIYFRGSCHCLPVAPSRTISSCTHQQLPHYCRVTTYLRPILTEYPDLCLLPVHLALNLIQDALGFSGEPSTPFTFWWWLGRFISPLGLLHHACKVTADSDMCSCVVCSHQDPCPSRAGIADAG
jgi:hypothetical protein